jgi:hypothetical protein
VRIAKVFAFVAAASVAVACGKGPAQEALNAANAAVEGARAEGAKFVPDQFKSLSDAAADAKAKFDAGDYKAALDGAQAVTSQAAAVLQAAGAKKTEVMAAWKAMEMSLPAMVGEISKKVMELAAAKKLPAGMDKAALDGAKTALEGATAAWTEAGAAFQNGDVMAAVTKAAQVKTTAEELMGKLGIAMPAPADAATAAAAKPADEGAKK